MCFLLPFWYHFLFIFGSLFWFRFLSPPGCILGPKNAPRGCKTTPPSTQNCSKTMCFFVFFAHRLFRRFDASSCLLGPLLVPTLPLQSRFWHPFLTPNRLQKRLPEKALGTQRNSGLLRLLAKGRAENEARKEMCSKCARSALALLSLCSPIALALFLALFSSSLMSSLFYLLSPLC